MGVKQVSSEGVLGKIVFLPVVAVRGGLLEILQRFGLQMDKDRDDLDLLNGCFIDVDGQLCLLESRPRRSEENFTISFPIGLPNIKDITAKVIDGLHLRETSIEHIYMLDGYYDYPGSNTTSVRT